MDDAPSTEVANVVCLDGCVSVCLSVWLSVCVSDQVFQEVFLFSILCFFWVASDRLPRQQAGDLPAVSNTVFCSLFSQVLDVNFVFLPVTVFFFLCVSGFLIFFTVLSLPLSVGRENIGCHFSLS